MNTILYLSHGGGPLPLLNDPSHENMVAFMKELPKQIPRPTHILVISAHWEEKTGHITGKEKPELLYDYYGFPPETYQLDYPVQGDPAFAKKIQSTLEEQALSSLVDISRDLDHGVFIPLMLMYPEGGIPVLQISLNKNLKPADHLQLGRALGKLEMENTLIIGSGFSFHNMREFRFDGATMPDPKNDAFQDWLKESVENPSLTLEEREALFLDWEKAPHARYCHPREEHLLPLHVCLGMAQKAGETIFDAPILGKRSLAFRWDV